MTKLQISLLATASFICGMVLDYNPNHPSSPNWWIPIIFCAGLGIGRWYSTK